MLYWVNSKKEEEPDLNLFPLSTSKSFEKIIPSVFGCIPNLPKYELFYL